MWKLLRGSLAAYRTNCFDNKCCSLFSFNKVTKQKHVFSLKTYVKILDRFEHKSSVRVKRTRPLQNRRGIFYKHRDN